MFASKLNLAAVSALFALAAAQGCATDTAPEGKVAFIEQNAMPSLNGLLSINGLTTTNGMPSLNGLLSINGLTSLNESTGLPTTWAMAGTDSGRMVLKYMIRCALPAGHDVTLYDADMTPYTFSGGIGVAPQWESGACNETCQEWVSSCLLAHVNLTGNHVPLWLDASNEALGWGQSSDYPRQEGVYFGNIFVDHPTAYACKGVDADVNPIAGRLCLGQEGCPYVDAFPGGSCDTGCDEQESGDGYTKCTINGRTFERPITVWTH